MDTDHDEIISLNLSKRGYHYCPDIPNNILFCNLSHNHLTWISIPRNLFVLNLSNNRLRQLDNHSKNFKLKSLNLDNNYFSKLPKLSSHMEILNINNNQIYNLNYNDIPLKVSILSLRNNNLSHFDFSWCCNRKRTSIIDLRDNKIHYLYIPLELAHKVKVPTTTIVYTNKLNYNLFIMDIVNILDCVITEKGIQEIIFSFIKI